MIGQEAYLYDWTRGIQAYLYDWTRGIPGHTQPK